MQYLTSIHDIVPQYDFFILDLWGTLHNGKHFFPEVLPFLTYLQDHHKKIIFISNSPRQKKYFIEDLKDPSINLSQYGEKITAGELFLNEFEATDILQAPFYFVGSTSLKTELSERIPAKFFRPLDQATYILWASMVENDQEIILEGLKRNLPLVCINPDQYVMDGNQPIPRPGKAALEYEQQGGQVLYFGKPYPLIFQKAFELMGNPDKSKLLFLGDSLYTDIKGANNMGIDSLLVNTGVHFIEDALDPWARVNSIGKTLGIRPTYGALRLQ